MDRRTILKAFTAIISAALIISLTACSNGAVIPKDYQYDDLSEYIKLGEYKGIEYTKAGTDVSEEEIDSQINSKLAENAETVQNKSGTVKKDSVVNIDYVGSIDGVEFEGGSAKDVELDIANSGYIKGFAEGIVGHKVGETFDLKVTFPDDYGKEELNGKPAVFKTTINYIVEKKTPAFDDEWVKSNSDYNTTKEYRDSVKEQLKADKEKNAGTTEKSEVFGKVAEASEVIKYPEKELEARKEQITTRYAEYARSSNMELEEFISSQMGLTKEDFNKMAEEAAQDTVKQELILYSIADKEGIEISQSSYNDYLDNLLKDEGFTKETFEEQNGKSIEEFANENNLFTSYLYQEVMGKVMEYSVGK